MEGRFLNTKGARLLTLFQLDVIVPIDPDDSLAKRLKDMGTIVYSKKLSSGEEVGELFPEPHSLKHLHIVVQYDDILVPSGPSGEYRWLIVPYEQN